VSSATGSSFTFTLPIASLPLEQLNQSSLSNRKLSLLNDKLRAQADVARLPKEKNLLEGRYFEASAEKVEVQRDPDDALLQSMALREETAEARAGVHQLRDDSEVACLKKSINALKNTIKKIENIMNFCKCIDKIEALILKELRPPPKAFLSLDGPGSQPRRPSTRYGQRFDQGGARPSAMDE
jgi:hypothetical protein